MQVGLNQQKAEVNLFGIELSIFETAAAQVEDPGFDDGEGLACDDVAGCQDEDDCPGAGYVLGCDLDCENETLPESEEEDVDCGYEV